MTHFVTSFSPDLYEASGKRLIESFLGVQLRLKSHPAKLVVCTEGAALRTPPPAFQAAHKAGLVDWFSLDDYQPLHAWLHAYRRIIPDYLGGEAKECQCPDREERHARHKARPGCHWQWMNRNASRWFRKIVALRYAVMTGGPKMDRLLWMDADAYVHKPLPLGFMTEHLMRWAMFYFRGHRPAVESGILGFELANRGADVVHLMYERYMSGQFEKYPRWDDGYQFAMLVDENRDPKLKFNDLVHPRKYRDVTNDVIPKTVIHPYLRHDKGRHGRGLDIMK